MEGYDLVPIYIAKPGLLGIQAYLPKDFHMLECSVDLICNALGY